MNVTDRGYYTTTYLDNVNNRSSGRRKKVIINDSSLPTHQVVSTTIPSGASQMESPSGTNLMPISPDTYRGYNNDELDPDELHEEITPAQLNYLQKGYQKNRNSYYDDESTYSKGDSAYSRNNSETPVYDNYYHYNQKLKIPRATPKFNSKSKRNKKVGDDYYINQKKRYDEAEFYKPVNYTHKTFKDVFTDKDESSGKYNPMESVFDDPEKVKEQEEKQKLKKAFKTIQVRLGKNDYDNYDYYRTPKTAVNEIFVTGGSVSDDDSDYGQVQDIAEPEETFESAGATDKKKKVNFKKMWKTKTKQLKKELGKDYMNNMEKQWEMEIEVKKKKEAKQSQIEELDDDEPIEPDNSNAQFYAGPKPEFHPVWNYLLSWVTYDQSALNANGLNQNGTNATAITTQSKAISIAEETIVSEKPKVTSPKPKNKKDKPKRIKVTTDQIKNFNRNLVKMKNMWTMPASNLFNNDPNSPIAVNSPMMYGSGGTLDEPLPQSLVDINGIDAESQEFIIEVEDGDETNYDEELYYNPNTGQLEREPPTSHSAMPNLFDSRNLSSVMPSGNFYIDTSNGAKTIVSNINSLIKSIKIMKIIFAPIDIIGESFPNLQTIVILIELIIFMWILYELSLLIDALCMMVKAVCAPMIAMGRFMNRIM